MRGKRLMLVAVVALPLVFGLVWLARDRAAPTPPAEEPADPLAPRPFEISGVLEHLALSPDGTFVVAMAYHGPQHSMDHGHRGVRLMDVEPGNKSGKSLQWTIPYTASPSGVAIAPDGRRVAVAETHFDYKKAEPDVRAAYTTKVGVWDTATGKLTATLTGSKAHQLYHAAFSPDGRHLAAGGALLNRTAQADGGGVTVWDTGTGQVMWSDLDHKAIQTQLAFSPDGKLLAAAGNDRMLRVWEVHTGTPVQTIETQGYNVFSVSFSLDGRLLAGGGGDGAARVWDVATGDERHVLRGYKKSTNVQEQLFVRFLPNGSLLTAGAAEKDDGSLKVWEVETGVLVKAIANPNRSVWWLDLTADGKTAVVATYVVGTWQKEQSVLFVPLTK
jgi:WD40 repeat protein